MNKFFITRNYMLPIVFAMLTTLFCINTVLADDDGNGPLKGSDFVVKYYLSGTYNNTPVYTIEAVEPKISKPCHVVPLDGVINIQDTSTCQTKVLIYKGGTVGFWHKDLLNDNLVLTTFKAN